VALGNQQKEGSYSEIKSGTVKATAVKIAMALKAKIGSTAMALDVKGAYLKSSIKVEYEENIHKILPNKKKVKLL
jgi:hypothetical protein